MSQIKGAKSKKSDQRKKSSPKKAAKSKTNQINAENSRASSEPVTTPETPTEGSINAVFGKMRALNVSHGYHSQPIKVNQSSDAWVRAVARCGANRATLLNCVNVTRTNLPKFIEYPAKYLTLHDICFMSVVTGLSVGRQIELLWCGVERYMRSSTDPVNSSEYPMNSNLSSLVAED